jgi:hypothetical protein
VGGNPPDFPIPWTPALQRQISQSSVETLFFSRVALEWRILPPKLRTLIAPSTCLSELSAVPETLEKVCLTDLTTPTWEAGGPIFTHVRALEIAMMALDEHERCLVEIEPFCLEDLEETMRRFPKVERLGDLDVSVEDDGLVRPILDRIRAFLPRFVSGRIRIQGDVEVEAVIANQRVIQEFGWVEEDVDDAGWALRKGTGETAWFDDVCMRATWD